MRQKDKEGILLKKERKTALELMRLEGICKLITDNIEKEVLENRYLRVTDKGKVDDLEKAIKQRTKSQLIDIISISHEITDDLIQKYFDNYRYGMKPGFVLNWASGFSGKTLTENSLRTDLQTQLSTYTYQEGSSYKNLKCSNVVKWNEHGIPVFEISLNYLKKHNYIDENDKFNYVYEMVECFVWVCSEKGFVAIYNMPSSVEKLIRKAFYSIYGIKIIGISLDKKILDTIFDSSNRKKVALTQLKDNPNMPQKATFSDSQFGQKETEILKDFNDGYGITSCLYDEDIKGDIVTMGVNNNKGKLYINKNVSAEQFRQWSVDTIVSIMNYYSDILSDAGVEKFHSLNLFSSNEWKRMGIAKKELLKQLALAMIKISISSIDVLPVDISALDFYKAFRNDSQYILYGNCSTCNDDVIPKCPNCSSQNLKLVGDKIVCEYCGTEHRYCVCDCGNNIFYDAIDEIIAVNIHNTLIEKIVAEIMAVDSNIHLDAKDTYVLQNGHLKHIRKDEYNVIMPQDIEEFKSLYAIDIRKDMFEEYSNDIAKMGEKCTKPSIGACNECKYNHEMETKNCILKLFTVFDEFIPQPHQGHEFGDIKLSVSVGSKSYTLQGILKSNHSKITKSSTTGKEILSQAISGLVDDRVELLAIIAPATFDVQLMENIIFISKLTKKHVVFLNNDFIFRLYALYNYKFLKVA
mgnify:CR=1 FL=1